MIRTGLVLSLTIFQQESDFSAVAPEGVLVRFAPSLRIFPPPFEIPKFSMMALWHERTDRSPAHQWVREKISGIAARMTETGG